jgi:hypothetical protein
MNQRVVSLFRKEAVVAQRDVWLGSPRLIQPISVQLATVIGIIVVCLIGAVLVFGEYTRRVRVHLAVVPSAGVLHVLRRRRDACCGPTPLTVYPLKLAVRYFSWPPTMIATLTLVS